MCVSEFREMEKKKGKGGKQAEEEHQQSWGLIHQQPKASKAKVTKWRRVDHHVTVICKEDHM